MRVLQAPVVILDNVLALIIGLVPNVINAKLDGTYLLIVLNAKQVGQGMIVVNVILIQATWIHIHTAQVR